MTKIKEDLIHYIWKTKSFNQQDLRTTDGQEIQILSFGHHNDDAGPHFLNARIDIDTMLMGYHNMILHVVMDADVNIKLSDQTTTPSLELKLQVDHKLI